MSSDAGFSHGDETSGAPPQRTIRLTVPERYYLLPGAGILAGTTIGLLRGSRLASLRFLAENVHRPPTTVKGWYFYNKTKNYRVMMGGLREAGVQALRLGTTAAGWVCIEEACARLGWGDVSEVAAGLGTAGVFAAVCESRPLRLRSLFRDSPVFFVFRFALFFFYVSCAALCDCVLTGRCRPATVESGAADDGVGGHDRGGGEGTAVGPGQPEGAGPGAEAGGGGGSIGGAERSDGGDRGGNREMKRGGSGPPG